MENHEPFGAKWSMFCRLKVRSYVLAANVAGTLKVAPLQILKFPVVLPHKFLDAEKFNLRFSDASEITEIADKLRWYRYQKGLRQRDAADYAGIDRSTYIHYEEAGRDFYPKEHMEKLAELFEVPLEDLLDDYNLFLLRGQGAQIKAIRQRLGLTQRHMQRSLASRCKSSSDGNRVTCRFSNLHGRSISSRVLKAMNNSDRIITESFRRYRPMIIKSSTALCNDYSMISDLAHEKAEQREETLKLRAKMEAAETARISGAPAYTLVESRKRLEAIYQRD